MSAGVLAGAVYHAAPLPPRVVIVGEPGVGKTTLARDLGAVIIPCEAGASYLDPAPALLLSEPHLGTSTDYKKIIGFLDALLTEEHSFPALAIDTVDALEKIIWRQVAADNGMGNIEGLSVDFNKTKALSYGKGYIVALDYLSAVLSRLNALRCQRGMLVILLAHSTATSTLDLSLERTEQHDLALHKKAAHEIRAWADAVFFAAFERPTKIIEEGMTSRRVPTAAAKRRVLLAGDVSTAPTKVRFSFPEKTYLVPGNAEVRAALARFCPHLAPPQAAG